MRNPQFYTKNKKFMTTHAEFHWEITNLEFQMQT